MADYATRAVLKEMLGIEADDLTRDTLLDRALSSASASIDRTTGRRFDLDASATARVYNPRGRVVCAEDGERLIVDDIGDDADLVVETGASGSFTAVTGYETVPDNALARGRAVTSLLLPLGTWGRGTTRTRVTARWGWPAVPDDIVQAALLQASRLFNRRNSPEGIKGSAEWGVIRLSRRDPDVWALIEPFILPGFG